MSSSSPSIKHLVAGHARESADEARRSQNQQALEAAGHVQSIPMTAQGIAQLRMLRDVARRDMQERGIPLAHREDALRSDPSVSLKSWSYQAQVSVLAARPDVQQMLANRAQQEMDERRMREHPGA